MLSRVAFYPLQALPRRRIRSAYFARVLRIVPRSAWLRDAQDDNCAEAAEDCWRVR